MPCAILERGEREEEGGRKEEEKRGERGRRGRGSVTREDVDGRLPESGQGAAQNAATNCWVTWQILGDCVTGFE